MRGFLETGWAQCLADSRLVAHRLKPGFRLPTFTQNLGRHFLARPATRGNAQIALESPQILNPGFGGFADLLIGNRVADTDVHDFSASNALKTFKRKCE